LKELQRSKGGYSRCTRDIRYAHEDVDGFTMGIYGGDEMLNDIVRVTGGRAKLELARVVVGRSRELMHSSWVVGVREEERFI
jgi:hypothetical protein